MLESALRDEVRTMEFPHQRHVYATALETQGLEGSTHQAAHMRVNSLSSKGSSSDFSVLRTPQDTLLSDTEAVIKEEHVPWQPSMGLVQEQITSSPVDELQVNLRAPREKPMQMQINTTFTQRPRPSAFSAHPTQRPVMTQASNAAPRSATAAFPPVLLPSPARAQPVTRQDSTASSNEVPLQGQHRRTQSAPLLSLAPVPTAETTTVVQQPVPQPPAPLRIMPNMGTDVLTMATPYASLTHAAHVNVNPAVNFATPAARQFVNPATFTPFTFPAPAAAGQAVATPMMWPYFPPQTAPPRAFFPTPPVASPPANTLYSAAPPVPWKAINPNSQPQMPLSHLIGQANGMIVGGPSAHNRKIGLYKTEICRNWEEKQSCRYGVKCQFAHGTQDIRTVPRHPKYKTEICRTFWVTGSCPYGKRCCFIHPTATSANPQTPASAGVVDDMDRETQHAISLLARLDLKRNSPDAAAATSPGGARHTPDTDVSDPTSFIYPGLGITPNEGVKV